MTIELIRGELERLYSLEDMLSLSLGLLGFDPADVGGTASPASFARALTDHCVSQDALAALVDAVGSTHKEVAPKLDPVVRGMLRAPVTLKPNASFGDFTIKTRVGAGPNGTVYRAEKDEKPISLKILHAAALHDRSGVYRFLTRNRLIGRLGHPHLPQDIDAGFVDDKAYVASRWIDGKPLASRIARTGPLHINEARVLMHQVLDALSALFEANLVHGAIKLENILVSRDDDNKPVVTMIDAGGDHLGSAWMHSDVTTSGGDRIKGVAPEQLQWLGTTPKSDMYGFGAMLFETLTGKPPLAATTATDLAIAHLSKTPAVAGELAPRGWVTEELSNLCERLLDKNPKARPNLPEVLEAIGPVNRAQGTIPEDEFTDLIDALVADPTDAEAAINVELTLDRNADPTKVAEAFLMAAEMVEPEEMAKAAGQAERSKAIGKVKAEAARDRGFETQKSLMFRAARLFDTRVKDAAQAETVYKRLLDLAPDDEVALIGYENALAEQDKLEDLVERLLQISESSDSHSERGRALHRIGRLYAGPLEDNEQASFAFAQALSQDVRNEQYAEDLERAAGNDMARWAEAMQTLHGVSEHPSMPPETRVALFMRLGHWYNQKISRPDLAVPCYQAVLAVDPSHEDAMGGIADVYRRAQQWPELVAIRLTQAERATMAERRRHYRTRAAKILETRMNDASKARALYEETLVEDPGHTESVEALAGIYQRGGDDAGYAKILAKQANALTGTMRAETLCKLGELNESTLDDVAEAERNFQSALDVDPGNLNAVRGLDRVFSRTHRYQELLENLEKQIGLAATPRQKIGLHERIAGIYDEEFLDHQKAADSCEKVLALDGGHANALNSLVRHYRALDRWDDIVEQYDRSMKVVTDNDRRVEMLLAQGRVLLEQVGSPERARQAYERVLQIDASNAKALESLAQVTAATGDAVAALNAVESLAEKAETPQQKADLWLRAAGILEEHGDRDGAIERLKLALDAQPDNSIASSQLRAAHLSRGDAASAVKILGREIQRTTGKLQKARLFGELAELRFERLQDFPGAREAATQAIDLDPTSIMGLLVLGDLAFEEKNYNQATTHYGTAVGRAESLQPERAKVMLLRYIEALAKTGSTEKASGVVDMLLKLAPDDPSALIGAGRVRLDSEDAVGALAIFDEVQTKFGDDLGDDNLAELLLQRGRAFRVAGRYREAEDALKEAGDLRPDADEPIDELAAVYEAEERWDDLVRVKQRRLDVTDGETRARLLLDIGEVYATHVQDPTRAAKSFVAALDANPDDRRVLTRLMRLYSEEKDWGKLVDVVLKLGEGVEDPTQKNKYIFTAAGVCARQLGDEDRALLLLEQILAVHPEHDKALEDALAIKESQGDTRGLIEYLRRDMARAKDTNDLKRLVSGVKRAGLAHKKLGQIDEAVTYLERAQELDPDSIELEELLAEMYQNDPERFFDKAVKTQLATMRKSPFDAQHFRKLRRLYTGAKLADPAWCVCQALHVMNSAEPDEERFFRRMRPDTAAEAKTRLNDEQWAAHLHHPNMDPLVTRIFQIIEPAVLHRNTKPVEHLGYQKTYALDLAMHPYPMSQTLFYAAGVLGMRAPMTFQNPNDNGGLSFLHAQPPSIVLGQAALAAELPTQAAAFVAARHLTYYRSGFYVRQLVPTGTGLRSWLFAAIKLIHDKFPIAATLDSMVKENLETIRSYVTGPEREQLASSVTKLIEGGAIDLKRWVAGVDLTADRAGFLVCHDLEVSAEMLKASDEASAAVNHRDRLKELTLYSVGQGYAALRQSLGINIDA